MEALATLELKTEQLEVYASLPVPPFRMPPFSDNMALGLFKGALLHAACLSRMPSSPLSLEMSSRSPGLLLPSPKFINS